MFEKLKNIKNLKAGTNKFILWGPKYSVVLAGLILNCGSISSAETEIDLISNEAAVRTVSPWLGPSSLGKSSETQSLSTRQVRRIQKAQFHHLILAHRARVKENALNVIQNYPRARNFLPNLFAYNITPRLRQRIVDIWFSLHDLPKVMCKAELARFDYVNNRYGHDTFEGDLYSHFGSNCKPECIGCMNSLEESMRIYVMAVEIFGMKRVPKGQKVTLDFLNSALEDLVSDTKACREKIPGCTSGQITRIIRDLKRFDEPIDYTDLKLYRYDEVGIQPSLLAAIQQFDGFHQIEQRRLAEWLVDSELVKQLYPCIGNFTNPHLVRPKPQYIDQVEYVRFKARH